MVINGLTEKEYCMLDILWSFENFEDIKEWQVNLSPENSDLVEKLIFLLMIEAIDEGIDNQDLSQTKELLLSIFNKN